MVWSAPGTEVALHSLLDTDLHPYLVDFTTSPLSEAGAVPPRFWGLAPGTSPLFRPQLHHLVSDDVCLKVVELYLNEKKRGAAGGNLSSRCVRAARETSYQWKAERCMADENCFKVSGPPGSAPHEASRRERAPPTGLVRWAPSSGPSGKDEAWRLGKRGALMTVSSSCASLAVLAASAVCPPPSPR